MEKCQLQRCLEKLDWLSASDGAMTFLEGALDGLLLLQGARPPFTPEQDRILKAVTEWPTKEGPAR